MTNYTMDTYEIKREILKYSKKISKGLTKSSANFVQDMEYGISKSKSVLISNISRALDEKIKLGNTIERLCDNLNNLSEQETKIIIRNYQEEVKQYFPEEPIALFDDSDIAKKYGKKFEDLDRVRDGSEEGKIVNGYNVCEAVVLTKDEKQPISLYSKIYSCKSAKFRSKNNYTKESIEVVKKVLNKKSNMVFDRGYDDNKIIDLVDKNEDYFVIRMNDKRNFLFKGKKKNCHDMAINRKGKVIMKLTVGNDEEIGVMLSHTKVTLPHNNKEYELVIVYGLKEDKPMKLLTNRNIKNKEDLIRVVRLYMYRWRVEEYFRTKKQEYEFENMRVRTIKAMNNLNLMLMIHMGHLGILGEKINSKLLSIKIIERSKSIRNKICLWLNQLARGIKEILAFAKTGIEEFKRTEKRKQNQQLSFKL